MVENPFQTLILWLKKGYRFWFFPYFQERLQVLLIMLQGMILLPAILGILISFHKLGKKIVPLLLVVLYFMLLHMVTTAFVRYSIPVMPYMIIFGILGVVGIKNKLLGDK